MRPCRFFAVFLLFFTGVTRLVLSGQTVANYTFTPYTGIYTQLQGTAGSVSPSLSGGSLDDGWFNSVPIGFSFTYEGVSYTTLSASTNGWFTFGSTLSSSAYVNNLSTGTPRPVVAPLWDDLAMGATGDFTYYTTGVTPNRVFTVEWLNMKWNYATTTPSVSFQVKLFESNRRIEFVYRQEAGTPATTSASIGLAGVTSGVFLSLNGTGTSPAASSGTETTTLSTSPSTGRTYRFDSYKIRPVITGVTPLASPLGTTVSISGSGFEPNTAGNTVYFGATKATVLTSGTTAMTVTLPSGALYKPVSETNSDHLTGWYTKPYDVTFPCQGYSAGNMIIQGSPVNFTAGNAPSDVAIGDIDRDGKPDLVVTNQSSNTVSVYRNISTMGSMSTSSFAPKVDFTTGNSPCSVAVSDLDGDGKLDVIVSNNGSSTVSVLRNTSTTGVINSASLAAKVDFATTSAPKGLDIADMDQDGKPDILVVCNVSPYKLDIFRNVSTSGSITTASFSAAVSFATSTGPVDVSTGDIDGDGIPDVVCTDFGASRIEIWRNTSVAGTFSFGVASTQFTLSQPVAAKVSDLDGDGKADIAIANQGDWHMSVYQNFSTTGSFSFSARHDYYATNGQNDLNIDDINGDGKPEIIITGQSNTGIGVYTNNTTVGSIGTASFGSCYYYYVASGTLVSTASGDLNDDGKSDIIATDASTNDFAIFPNQWSQFINVEPNTCTGSTSYCYDGTWKVYFHPVYQNRALFAVEEKGTSLGLTVDEYKNASPGTYNGMRFLARHFRITPTVQPPVPVRIRLFYLPAELTALEAVDPTVTSPSSLSVTQYDGPTEDATYNPTDATSLTWIPQTSITTGTAYGGNYLEFTVSNFSEFWIHGGGGVLPIELLDFNATPVDNTSVKLTWSTASETNNDFFTVEKTRDGTNFETVTTVDGAGNSTQTLHYETVDEHPYDGLSYYRLKQTDFNGHATYSGVVPVEFDNGGALFNMYPNPSDGTVHFTFPGDPEEEVTLRVFDLSGREVSTKTAAASSLMSDVEIFEPGIYIVRIEKGGKQFCRRLVVN
ncbi:MAG TPA: FG-GAP-like repeat-containing protein [Bacteroidia bacterium]|nr:FG-GAP-like repeat-containing protein [Bacteroidia bacterium]